MELKIILGYEKKKAKMENGRADWDLEVVEGDRRLGLKEKASILEVVRNDLEDKEEEAIEI